MKKQLGFICVLLAFTAIDASAQYDGYGGRRVIMRRGPNPRYQRPPQRPRRPSVPFTPTVNLSFGYGFPNVDQYRMASFYNAYKGNASQTGPFMAALDYQFSRYMSIGVMATYGKVSAPYFHYDAPAGDPFFFNGKLENTALMLNVVNYIPAGHAVSPYFRLAAGVNIWNQQYTDDTGHPLDYIIKPSLFAYQVSFGAKFNLSERAALFAEAGYGKYIVNGGLAFKF